MDAECPECSGTWLVDGAPCVMCCRDTEDPPTVTPAHDVEVVVETSRPVWEWLPRGEA